MSRRVVVVGGGLGGLAVALRLAVRGWRVTVCEQGPAFGGKMNRWAPPGFRFDTGPSLITMPWVFRELFAAAGAELEDHLELVPVHPHAEYTFADGTRLTCSSSLPEWVESLRRLEPRDVDGFFRFLHLGARIFALSSETFLRRPPLARPDRRVLAALRHFPLRRAWGNYHRTVAACVRSPYLVQLLDRYPTYVGSSPYRSPATLAVIPYLELAFGAWYVRGGLYRVVEALVELLGKRGVELRTGTRVEEIASQGGKVTGVRLAGGGELDAPVVVMNGDASDAPRLLGRSPAVGLPPGERSLSGLVFLLAVRRTLPDLPHHSVYFSADYPAEFAQLFDERRFPDEPTVYVSAPSRQDRSLVPAEGGETLFIMANAPAGGAGEEPRSRSDADLTEARRRVFQRLRRGGFPELTDGDLAAETVWTPDRFARAYAMPGGAIYGTHSHGWRRAFLRPPNRDRRVGGLYYVGGSTHPGGGTPTVLLSAAITSELIRENHEG